MFLPAHPRRNCSNTDVATTNTAVSSVCNRLSCMSESLSVRVVARFRPVNARELREMQGGKDAFAYAIASASGSSSGQQSVALSGRLLASGDFVANLDRVLDTGTTQDEMFDEV